MGKKIGRNDPCSCGSGKKFKRCHGDLNYLDRMQKVSAALPNLLARHKADEVQRQRQQGKGSPIISLEANGERLVAIKNRFLSSSKWRTFHDFLGDYIKSALGGNWGNAEIAKPLGERHPVMVWYHYVCQFQREQNFVPGKINSGACTGAVSAYLHLAYDLYALDHNAELQTKLLNRLKDRDNFSGARYEIVVAATLIRAGFQVEFEDETDRQETHCEYVVTYRETGKKFSVEVKCSDAGVARVTRQLFRALHKQALHPRIVFIDLNTIDSVASTRSVELMPYALRRIRRFEADPAARALAPAYVFLTNHPWHLMLGETDIKCSAMGEGFKIPDFKMDQRFDTVRRAVDARQEHIEMHDLLLSMKDHAGIPVTFDGSMPEFTFGTGNKRLIVGQEYLVPDGSGRESVGTLESAIVMESDSSAWCVVCLKTGERIHTKFPMNRDEMSAWRNHPDTFFGVLEQRTHHVRDHLEAYDFAFRTYRNTPKGKLLEFMASAPDINDLKQLDQLELARIYCERMAMHMMSPKPAKH